MRPLQTLTDPNHETAVKNICEFEKRYRTTVNPNQDMLPAPVRHKLHLELIESREELLWANSYNPNNYIIFLKRLNDSEFQAHCEKLTTRVLSNTQECRTTLFFRYNAIPNPSVFITILDALPDERSVQFFNILLPYLEYMVLTSIPNEHDQSFKELYLNINTEQRLCLSNALPSYFENLITKYENFNLFDEYDEKELQLLFDLFGDEVCHRLAKNNLLPPCIQTPQDLRTVLQFFNNATTAELETVALPDIATESDLTWIINFFQKKPLRIKLEEVKPYLDNFTDAELKDIFEKFNDSPSDKVIKVSLYLTTKSSFLRNIKSIEELCYVFTRVKLSEPKSEIEDSFGFKSTQKEILSMMLTSKLNSDAYATTYRVLTSVVLELKLHADQTTGIDSTFALINAIAPKPVFIGHAFFQKKLSRNRDEMCRMLLTVCLIMELCAGSFRKNLLTLFKQLSEEFRHARDDVKDRGLSLLHDMVLKLSGDEFAVELRAKLKYLSDAIMHNRPMDRAQLIDAVPRKPTVSI